MTGRAHQPAISNVRAAGDAQLAQVRAALEIALGHLALVSFVQRGRETPRVLVTATGCTIEIRRKLSGTLVAGHVGDAPTEVLAALRTANQRTGGLIVRAFTRMRDPREDTFARQITGAVDQ